MYLDKNMGGRRDAAASLEPPLVEEAVDGTLDPELFEAKVVIPVYTGKALGDYITMYWKGATDAGSMSDSISVNASNLPRVIRLSVFDEHIAPNDGHTVDVHYTVEHEDGTTETSDTITIAVGEQAPEPGLVEPPDIEGVVNGVLNLEDVPADGAKAIVMPYAGMGLFDVVFININNDEWSDAKELTSAIDIDRPVEFKIPRIVLSRFSGRQISIKTQVVLTGAGLIESREFKFRVLEPVGDLPKVVVPLSDGTSLQPEDVVGPTVEVIVKPYQGIAEGDVIEFRWSNASGSPGVFIETVTVGATPQQDYVFEVPRAHVDQNRDKSAFLSYSVRRGGGQPVNSELFTLFIGEAFEAAMTVDATGKGYLVGPKPPSDAPAFATYTREAKFGVVPHTYQSSDTAVAVVDNAGHVVAVGNGTAAITATDAMGESRSHPVTVKGIREVHFVSASANFAGAKNACASVGLALLTLDEMKAFWRNYYNGNGPVAAYMGWLSYLFWTGTQIGAGTAYAYDLNGGSEQGNATGRNEADFMQVIGVTP
ncbi:Ig-like domain-containing protein [Pandoraea pneumonica]|uniref:Ig-like domain-containing protein n=1 Tax=Pandoraea pneumonica TaxID=2508299 RepID=UPI003CEEEEEB